uniref:Uncharacterized protein n=1 Tax=Anguilla anguilla TaxID=7936 RepID=A0A0E9S739_ANGAN
MVFQHCKQYEVNWQCVNKRHNLKVLNYQFIVVLFQNLCNPVHYKILKYLKCH